MKRFAALVVIMSMLFTCGAEVSFPVKTSENNRYLTYADGEPFLYFADTGWFLFDALDTKNQEYYLETRAAQGFTAVQVMACWTFSKPNFYGEYPFESTGKVSTPNDAYWQRMVDFAKMAQDKGLLVNFVPLWLGYTGEQWWQLLGINTVDECYGFGQYLGELFKDSPNVIWTMGGDHDPGELYAQIDAIARGIKSVLPEVLISAHTWENQLAEDKYSEASWLSLNSVYTYFPQWNHGKNVYELSEKAYNSSLNLPFILIESGYENASAGNTVVKNKHLRRQVFWAALSGACGYAYGNANIWQFNGLWKQSLTDAGVLQVINADSIIRSIEWWKGEPANEMIEHYGYTGSDPVLCEKATDDSFMILYFPPANDKKAYCTLSADAPVFESAEWIDPANGDSQSAAPDETGRYMVPGKNSDGETDWVLLFRN